ncbi:nuclease-related domain-containing protein [Arthrobacter sp. LAPM80]|uniref:nuclease-related domain-containing protein n=1 Tax=Arthrobacter sp. LAPM80 TaxID=3141788 RepID=UPI00398B5653
MEQNVGAPASGASLRERVPGQSVITELLRIQGQRTPQNFLGRLFGVDPVSKEAQAWFAGALGEIEVGRILARLGPDYTVLHAVPVGAGSSDIDHVVIGPPGVFTLNTKHHKKKDVWVAGGTLMVNGSKEPHIRNSVSEGKRAAKFLSQAVGHPVDVTTMIVLVGASKLNIKKKPDTVEVLDSKTLLRWFKRRPVMLSPDDLATLADLAQHPELWHKEPAAEQNTDTLMADFKGIEQAVEKARSRRRMWGWGGMAAIVVAILAFGPALAASLTVFIPGHFGQ